MELIFSLYVFYSVWYGFAMTDEMQKKCVKVPGTSLEMLIDPDGFIFGAEAMALIEFTPDKTYQRAADLGCGDGILSILLAQQRQVTEIWSVDINEAACHRARTNIRQNHLTGTITIRHANIRKLQQLIQRSSFDLVLMNPPFFKPQTDYASGTDSEQSARQEQHANLRHFLTAAKFLLRKSGTAMILYHPSRLDHLFVELHAVQLIPKELKILYHQDGRPLFVLLRAVKDARPGLTIHPPHTMAPSIKHRMLEDS